VASHRTKTAPGESSLSDDLVPFGTRLPQQLAREVRAAAALEGRSVQDWVAEALLDKLHNQG